MNRGQGGSNPYEAPPPIPVVSIAYTAAKWGKGGRTKV